MIDLGVETSNGSALLNASHLQRFYRTRNLATDETRIRKGCRQSVFYPCFIRGCFSFRPNDTIPSAA